jgi:hypothetical protein
MKKYLIISAFALALFSCRPEPFGEIGDPSSVITGIEGTWNLNQVEIEDRSFPQWETRDVTDFYMDQNQISVEFEGATNQYTVSAQSATGHPFGTGGVYTYDDPEYPSQLLLIPAGMSDTVRLQLGNMVRDIDPEFKVEQLKSSCDAVYARYIYTFNRN